MSNQNRTIAAVVCGAVVVVVIISIVLITMSLRKLDSDEVGLMYDTFQKKLGVEPLYEGMHTGPPGLDFIIYPSVYRTFEFGGLSCLNTDGVRIYLDVSYQYRVRPKFLNTIVKQFKDHDGYKDVMYAIGKSSLIDACSLFNTSQFQAERGAFMEAVKERLTERYDPVKCDISDLQVQDIRRPQEYEDAIRDKEAAREDIEVALEERPRKLTEALTQKRQEETEAEITIRRAESDARVELTQAKSQADSIFNDYFQETETYRKTLLTGGLGLDPEGFLSYLAVRTISEAKQKVYVGIKAPAKTSYVP